MNVQDEGTAERKPGRTGGRGRGVPMLPAHIEHLCREIAEFRGADGSALVDSCIAAFPRWLAFMPDVKRRHWWADKIAHRFPRDRWGNVRDKCIHKARIDELRDMWRAASSDSMRIANRRGRLEMLQQSYDKAFAEGKYRDAAYVLHLAEREMGEAEMHAGPKYEIELTDDTTQNICPHAGAPAQDPPA